MSHNDTDCISDLTALAYILIEMQPAKRTIIKRLVQVVADKNKNWTVFAILLAAGLALFLGAVTNTNPLVLLLIAVVFLAAGIVAILKFFNLW